MRSIVIFAIFFTVNSQIEKCSLGEGCLTPTFLGKGSSDSGHVDVFGMGILYFLIAIHCNFGDYLHGFFTNLEMHTKFRVFRWHSPFIPKVRGLKSVNLSLDYVTSNVNHVNSDK